jgi:hypothetical protein
MSETFMGLSALEWIGVQTVVVLLTGWLIYGQVRIAARSFQLEGIREMQRLIDRLSEVRIRIQLTFPIVLALECSQFQQRPPGRQVAYPPSRVEKMKMVLTDSQTAALRTIMKDKNKKDDAIIAINLLNAIGQLMEDGFVEKGIFLGMHHVLIIRLVHWLEPVRRELDINSNYGQRLLRMRHKAIIYNTICPKHRAKDIAIFNSTERRVLVHAMKSSLPQRIFWFFRRVLGLY